MSSAFLLFLAHARRRTADSLAECRSATNRNPDAQLIAPFIRNFPNPTRGLNQTRTAHKGLNWERCATLKMVLDTAGRVNNAGRIYGSDATVGTTYRKGVALDAGWQGGA